MECARHFESNKLSIQRSSKVKGHFHFHIRKKNINRAIKVSQCDWLGLSSRLIKCLSQTPWEHFWDTYFTFVIDWTLSLKRRKGQLAPQPSMTTTALITVRFYIVHLLHNTLKVIKTINQFWQDFSGIPLQGMKRWLRSCRNEPPKPQHSQLSCAFVCTGYTGIYYHVGANATSNVHRCKRLSQCLLIAVIHSPN